MTIRGWMASRFCLLGLLLLVGSPHAFPCTSKVTVEPKVSEHSGSYALVVALTNRTTRAMEVSAVDYPWYPDKTLQIRAVAPSGAELQQRHYVYDMPWGRRTLQPGEVISGEIRLDSSFVDFSESLRKHRQIAVYWSYLTRSDDFLICPKDGVLSVEASDQAKQGDSLFTK